MKSFFAGVLLFFTALPAFAGPSSPITAAQCSAISTAVCRTIITDGCNNTEVRLGIGCDGTSTTSGRGGTSTSYYGACCITRENECRVINHGRVETSAGKCSSNENQQKIPDRTSSYCCIPKAAVATGGNVSGGGATATTQCTSPNRCAASCGSTETQVSGTCSTATQKCCAPAGSGGNASGAGGSGTSTGTLGSTTAINVTLANPLKFDTVEGVLTNIMGAIKGIVVTLALLMIVIGAIMYILSFGNPDNIKRAKNIIFAALIGLAIVIAAPAFLKEISVLLGWDNAPEVAGATQLTLTQIAMNVLKFLLSLIGVIAMIVMVIAGIMLLASLGNPDKRKSALEVLKAAIIGVAVAMGSMILVTSIARFFE